VFTETNAGSIANKRIDLGDSVLEAMLTVRIDEHRAPRGKVEKHLLCLDDVDGLAKHRKNPRFV
jgi:hypothetical protein